MDTPVVRKGLWVTPKEKGGFHRKPGEVLQRGFLESLPLKRHNTRRKEGWEEGPVWGKRATFSRLVWKDCRRSTRIWWRHGERTSERFLCSEELPDAEGEILLAES